MAAETKDKSRTDVELWLEGAGLQASSMDPSSLEALADVLSGQHVDFEARHGHAHQRDKKGDDDPSSSPQQQQQRRTKTEDWAAQGIVNITQTLFDEKEGFAKRGDKSRNRESLDRKLPPAFGRSSHQHDLDDRKLPPSYQEDAEEDEQSILIPDEATMVERLILERLGHQARMLKRLERRIDELKLVGDHHRITTATTSGSARLNAVDPKQQRFLDAMKQVQRGVLGRPDDPQPPRQPRVVVYPQPPARAGPPPAQPAEQPPRQRGAAVAMATRFRKCFNLYVSLRRHQVPNERFDVWMLVKIIFMLSILLAKDQSKLWTTLTVVVLGFMWQSGLAGFLYKFFVRYNYVGRIILYHEDITFESALAEQLNRQQPPAAGAEARDGAAAAAADGPEQRPPWWHVDPNRHPIVNGLVDVVMLFGSLILSIFPMWRVPDPPAARNEPPPAAAEDATANPVEGDVNRNHQHQQDGMIPVVRPPVDPAADSDDDHVDDDHFDDEENRDDHGN